MKENLIRKRVSISRYNRALLLNLFSKKLALRLEEVEETRFKKYANTKTPLIIICTWRIERSLEVMPGILNKTQARKY